MKGALVRLTCYGLAALLGGCLAFYGLLACAARLLAAQDVTPPSMADQAIPN